MTYGWGSALGPRYTKTWRHVGERGLVFEEGSEDNPNAYHVCRFRGWMEPSLTSMGRAESRLMGVRMADTVSDRIPWVYLFK